MPQGNGGDGFVTVFEGSEKQHRVVKLQPSTQYRFRLQAINDHGARYVYDPQGGEGDRKG